MGVPKDTGPATNPQHLHRTVDSAVDIQGPYVPAWPGAKNPRSQPTPGDPLHRAGALNTAPVVVNEDFVDSFIAANP